MGTHVDIIHEDHVEMRKEALLQHRSITGRKECWLDVGQCDIKTGTVMLDNKVRLTPPSTISRNREWP